MTETSPTQMWIVAAFTVATAAFFWILWLPIARRALRTGRLLGQGVVYDRQATPRRYWAIFLCSLALALVLTGIALFCVAWPLGLLS